MGKYTKKSRITGDIAIMEVTQSTALGVRTRARTLALQRLPQSPSTTASTTAAAAVVSCPNPDSSSCYLELRSRRLEKPLPPPPQPSVSKTQQGKVRLCGAGGEKKRESSGKKGGLVKCEPSEAEDMGGIGVEASCGENCLDFELRGRSTRETTPCSFIRDSETFGTPESTTRQNRSDAIDRRITNVKNAEERQHVPSTNEMEEFFSCVEQQQQRLFIEKYNFDVTNDMPLPGRYEWV